ncbi:MAG: preprotein translocase subunit SecE [Wolbachia endosymbiont of Meromenopon meropis]|nr:preprotein translocase subunit SecE [Wolbachia endosymbiont of Meromenopon meropis]
MFRALSLFFSDIKQEMRKVAWVKNQEVLSSLFVVAVVILCFSVFFHLVDFTSLCLIKALFRVIYGI